MNADINQHLLYFYYNKCYFANNSLLVDIFLQKSLAILFENKIWPWNVLYIYVSKQFSSSNAGILWSYEIKTNNNEITATYVKLFVLCGVI